MNFEPEIQQNAFLYQLIIAYYTLNEDNLLNIRKTAGNDKFRMDGCIDYLEIAVTARSAYGYTYELKHAKGYR